MAHTVKHGLDDLTGFKPRHDTFVGVDSDGCVFDTMEIKQKQCFHGLIIAHWKLEAIEKPVRQAAEFVNLYSKWRGQNRFIALIKMFELLQDHPDVKQIGVTVPRLGSLQRFMAGGGKLSDAALKTNAERTHDPEITGLLAWSQAVNDSIARTVKHVPPFEWARRSLEKIHENSDAACVSQTPTEALVREWRENGIDHLIALIAGQELGTKAVHLELATKGRYRPERVLMIGDAPGDHVAAKANGACFYPINPSHEEASWQRFHDEAYAKFLNGTFDAGYQAKLVAEFDALLPEIPPWQK